MSARSGSWAMRWLFLMTSLALWADREACCLVSGQKFGGSGQPGAHAELLVLLGSGAPPNASSGSFSSWE